MMIGLKSMVQWFSLSHSLPLFRLTESQENFDVNEDLSNRLFFIYETKIITSHYFRHIHQIGYLHSLFWVKNMDIFWFHLTDKAYLEMSKLTLSKCVVICIIKSDQIFQENFSHFKHLYLQHFIGHFLAQFGKFSILCLLSIVNVW